MVIDNTVLGPACGRIKISPTITPREVFNNARKMTLACALVNIKFGGAAAGIRANPFEIDRSKVIRSFAKKISPYVPEQYIASPDIILCQDDMAVFSEEVGDRKGATGKPESMGGIPFEIGCTGFGIGIIIESIIESIQSPSIPKKTSEAKITIQGFEHIGRTLSKYLYNKNAKIVGISDTQCTISDPTGINIDKLLQWYSENNGKHSLKKYNNANKMPNEDIVKIESDFFVPTTANDIITDKNIEILDSKCVVEGINDSIDFNTEIMLYHKGILVIPDILTIASGAINSYSEYNNHSSEKAFSLIESLIKEATNNVIHSSRNGKIPLRRIVNEIAKENILKEMEGVNNV
ncbi:MAG: Glu/Leu/Phe/Val dehydrogenase [Thermoplasmata archaeon]|nr:MAG: Glu/Leu/Phe/Val dehydrogenase [Thermoplasmata archaeon]